MRRAYSRRYESLNNESARQGQIEAKRPNEEDHSLIGKADEEERFDNAAASHYSNFHTGASIDVALFSKIGIIINL